MQLQIVRQLLHFDVTVAARLWLKRTDIAARVAGEALLVWPCTTKTADFIFWNYKVGTECYALLPVVVNETVFFALPGSEDLVLSPPHRKYHVIKHHLAFVLTVIHKGG